MVFARYVRLAMIDVMNEDYIRSAMARAGAFAGRRSSTVCETHRSHWRRAAGASRNPPCCLQGRSVVETAFVLPGIGRLIVTATLGREVLVVQSLVPVIMVFILTPNFMLDIAYGFPTLVPLTRPPRVIEVDALPLTTGDVVTTATQRLRPDGCVGAAAQSRCTSVAR